MRDLELAYLTLEEEDGEVYIVWMNRQRVKLEPSEVKKMTAWLKRVKPAFLLPDEQGEL